MATFKQDIREIRQGVYGIDVREPIADAIQKIKNADRPGVYDPVSVDTELDENIIDWIEIVPRTVYINFIGDSGGTTDLNVSQIDSTDDYLVIDSRSGDVATLISDNDYTLSLNNSNWETNGIADAESYIEHDIVNHKESYTLIIEANPL